jgi:prepilin-type N-terminal cleavage/methylation domain-containing protein
MITRRSSGFTMLELVVVMAIIAALAGIAVAKFDMLQLKSEKVAAASTMTNLMRNIQTYRAVTNFYPDRWDSLIDPTATPANSLRQPGPPGGAVGLDPGIAGGNGFTAKLTTDTLTANEQKSLARLGILTILNHTGDLTKHYREGFSTIVTLDGTGTPAVAVITPTSAANIVRGIYPQLPPTGTPVIPANKKLVVFGLGKYCTIVGNNTDMGMLAEAPTYTYSNAQFYDRYLAVFEVDANGGRSKLVAVLGADGDLAADELAAFNSN